MTENEEKLYWLGFERATVAVFGVNGTGRVLVGLIRAAPEAVGWRELGLTVESVRVTVSKLREALGNSEIDDLVRTETQPRGRTAKYRIPLDKAEIIRRFVEERA